MESYNTLFKINLNDPKNKFFDFQGEDGEEIEFSLSEAWVGDTQVVTVNAVPIPSAIFLLGGGLCALLGVGRRKDRG